MSSGRGLPGHRLSRSLLLRVRPGVELVRASFVPTSALITLDLPTLERPRKATSGRLGAGKCDTSVAAARNRARILMSQCAMSRARLASRAKVARERRSERRAGREKRGPKERGRKNKEKRTKTGRFGAGVRVYPFSELLRDETACSG